MSAFTNGMKAEDIHVFSCSDSAVSIESSNIIMKNVEISDCRNLAMSLIDVEHSEISVTNGFIHSNSASGFILNGDNSHISLEGITLSNNKCEGFSVDTTADQDTYSTSDETAGLELFQQKRGYKDSIRVIVEPNKKEAFYSDASIIPEQFNFYYNNCTLVRDMIKRCCQLLGEPYDPIEHNPMFHIQSESGYSQLNEDTLLCEVISNYSNNGELMLLYTL